MALLEPRGYSKEAQVGAGRPRKYRRRVASPKQWAAIRAEKLDGRVCRFGEGEAVLSAGTRAAEELHHLVPRKPHGGDDVADNLVGLCRPCHKLVTERDPSALAQLAALLTDGEYAYIHEKLGEGALERLFGVTYTGAK